MTENRRVLLVDDDPAVLETYREILTQTLRSRRSTPAAPAFDLAWASSGEEAIELVQREATQRRHFACGVFDMRMPGIDGLETISEIRKIDRKLLCAVCTAYSDRVIDEIDALFLPNEKDQWDYLQKPVTAPELLQKVRCLVSSWNRRRHEERQQARMAKLVSQLSRITSAQPGNVDAFLDILLKAVQELTRASRGALLQDGPDGMSVVRSWSDHEDPTWLERLTQIGRGQAPNSNEFVFFSVPSNGVRRSVALSTPAESDRELLESLGLLLDNAARLITLNSELQATNESLATHCQALATAREQTIQSAKLAAIGQVAAGVAHEVNTPLSVIQLETELVLDLIESGTPDPSCVEMSALQIQQEVQRIKRVVSQIRDFARKSNDQREPTSVASFVESALGVMKHRLSNEPVNLVVDIAPDLAEVNGDTTQLTQVLVNLIGNALDALRGTEHQRIFIKAYSSPLTPERIRIDICDTGPGMEPSVRERALDPFFTTKSPGHGTGLGLAVVQTIVDLHEGELELLGEPGEGTTVRIELPAVIRLPAEDVAAHLGQPRVIVVRGNPERALNTAHALREAGATAALVSSYREASERLGRGEADLVLADLEIDDTTVWTLLDDLEHSEGHPSPVLVIGRSAHTGQTHELKQLGISGQVAEPFDTDALKGLIGQTLEQQRNRSVGPTLAVNSV